MATLPTNLKDDILDASVNQRRRYNMITNPDGTVEFEDVTAYSQVGSEYGAGLINETNKQINGKVDDSKIVRDLKTIGAMTQEGFIPDALALKEVNESLQAQEVTVTTSGTFKGICTLKADTIKLNGYFKDISLSASSWTYGVIKIPYAPKKGFQFPLVGYGSGNTYGLFGHIDTEGNIGIYSPSASVSEINFNLVYDVN